MRRIGKHFILIGFAFLTMSGIGLAAEAGHYLPGVWNIRDWGSVPKGLYFEEYDVWYKSTDLKNAHGASVGSIPIGGRDVNISPNVNVFMFAPTLLWSTGHKIFGADFIMLATPTFGNTGVGARLNVLETNKDFGRQQTGVGDLFVTPIRLSWHNKKWDFSPAYGFYAPVGAYTPGAPDNVGLGFWSHQMSGSLYYYPKPDQSTAIMVTSLYEVNLKKSGLDDTAGSHWGMEYGFSQYLSKRLEVGVAGFNLLQVTHDSGADARSPTVQNRVNGVGPQATVWLVPGRFNVAFRAMWDYGVEARFNGTTANLSFTYVIKTPPK